MTGENQVMQRKDAVSHKDVEATLQWVMEEVNNQVDSQREKAQESNKTLLTSFCDGQLSAEELAANWQDEPGHLKVKSFKHMARKFTRAKQFTKQKTNTSGSYLSFSDPKMQEHLDSTR